MTDALNATDKAILNMLQDDAAMPLKTIAKQADISIATAQRRVQALIDSGVIMRQVAIVDPSKVGHGVTAIVMVEIERSNTSTRHQFERLMQAQSQVMNCYELSGEADFMLIINAESMSEFHEFTLDLLSYENNVRHYKSQFVMNVTKSSTKILLK